MMGDRVILHCDCNSFFASVETVFHPEYAKVPMAVAGSEEARHGIILAKNPLAGQYGIKTAETVREAKRKCPTLVLVPPRHGEYARFSKRVRQIYERYTDLVEPFGMDECWLDVTGSLRLFGSGEEIAHKIREEVKREIGITISVGVSFNKIYAKLGSDYKKPDAVTVISRENYKEIVYPLSVDSMIFVGARTAKELSVAGIKTIGELAAASDTFLSFKFGKLGPQLGRNARGEDDSPVASLYAATDPKSVGNGMTFRKDLTTEEEIRLGLEALSEEVAYRLRRAGMVCTTVGIHIKDPMLKSISRQMPQEPPSNLAREIAKTALTLLKENWHIGSPIRMLTVTGMNLCGEGEAVSQIGFFDEEKEARRKRTGILEETVDKLRERYGVGAVRSGAVIGNKIGVTDDGSFSEKTEENNGE